MKVFLPGLLVSFIAMALPSAAQNYTVNNNGDTHAANAASSAVDGSGNITLRSAVEASTAQPGTHVISFAGGITTINLTLGNISVGNSSAANNSVSINGPGMNVLTVNQTTAARIFTTTTATNFTFLIQDITLNYAGPATTFSGGGGALLAGGTGAVTTMINCKVTNFKNQVGNGGGVAVTFSTVSHNLAVTNCIFDNNKCGGGGGGLAYSGLGTVTITGCTFSNNSTGVVGANTGGSGGALNLTGQAPGGTYSVTKCHFINNTVDNSTSQGGAVMNVNGDLTLNYNRFTGNTTAGANLGSVIYQSGGDAGNTVNADNNWWGRNTGPASGEVNNGPSPVTAPVVNKWLQLKAAASPSSICSNSNTTITASFLSNSSAEAIAVANLGALVGLPVSFSNAVLGSLSSAQTTIQSGGTATVTYTSGGTAGAGSANAVVDNVPNTDATAKAAVTVNATPAITLQPSASTACRDLPVSFTSGASNQTSVVWQESSDAGFSSPATLGNTGIYSGAATTTLSLSNNTTVNGKYYRMVASNSNGCPAANSNGALLTVTAPVLPATTATETHVAGTNNNLAYGASCAIISKVVPLTGNPVSGNITSQVWRESSVLTYGGQPYVQRHYQITPASGSTATVTLYFSQADFDNFNSHPASVLKLPVDATDAANNKANLRISKFNGSSGDGTGLPGTYPAGGGSLLNPPDGNIIYNAGLGRWEVTFDVSGFSGFFVQTSSFVLPVHLISFEGNVTPAKTVQLKWKVDNQQDILSYLVEKSKDGMQFNTAGTLPANSFTSYTYDFEDNQPANGIVYYRLKITGRDGELSYSRIIKINLLQNPSSFIYPNPVKDKFIFHRSSSLAGKAELTDMAGRHLQAIVLQGQQQLIDMVNYSPGIYLLRTSDGNVYKIIKQ